MTPAAGVHPTTVCGQLRPFSDVLQCPWAALIRFWLCLNIRYTTIAMFSCFAAAVCCTVCRSMQSHVSHRWAPNWIWHECFCAILSKVNVWLCYFFLCCEVYQCLRPSIMFLSVVDIAKGLLKWKKYFTVCIYKSVGPLSLLRDLLGRGVYLLLTPAFYQWTCCINVPIVPGLEASSFRKKTCSIISKNHWKWQKAWTVSSGHHLYWLTFHLLWAFYPQAVDFATCMPPARVSIQKAVSRNMDFEFF